jgi:lysozyme
MNRSVCAAALALIERDEGLRLHAYRDVGGVLTIGYGHTGPDVHPGEVITKAAAEAIEAKDVGRFAALIEAHLGDAPTTDDQFGAMVSLAYNIGDGAFNRSTVLKKHRTGDRQGAADAFLLWDEVHGHVVAGLSRRRREERALYLSGGSSALRIGDRGPAVAELQQKLVAAGYTLAVDGDFGPQTARAVSAFQADEGLAVDGIAGPETMAALG